jgi:glycosyltransferase involved in cell wall biosynthesis
MLRVGFDGRDLLRKRTGVTGYTRSLARELGTRPGLGFLVYVDGFVDPHVEPPADVRLRRVPGPPLLWKHALLPAALVRDRVALFHSPTGTLPLWSAGKRVVTIHDLFADVEPAWFAPRHGLLLRRGQRRAARTADAMIAVSETTRGDVLRHYALPPERVRVVHNGVDHERFRPLDDPGQVAARLGVHPPYVLCVGSLMPWRNGPRLLRAVAWLRRQGLELDLVFVGRDIWGTDPTAAIAREQGWDAWTHLVGYLPDGALPGVYAAAAVFAYPSLYEGFGIPPLEAMACGTPVVASTAGALPEILGDAALLADPLSEESIARALATAVTDHQVRARLRARGLERAARYTWPRAAAETSAVYAEVLGG